MNHTAISSPMASSREKDSPSKKNRDERVTLAHGSGGKAMRELIQHVFIRGFDNPVLEALEDQAIIPFQELLQYGNRLAFTTDSYVVHPLFFPGGNIGELAVNGTVNDLAVSGARPLFLSCSMVMEEGLSMDTLVQVVESMKQAADRAGVAIVTGDTKVVERGSADKLFINTAGIGVVPEGISISAQQARPGDAILTNGFMGDHGVAILLARNELALESNVESDSQPLHDLIARMLEVCPDVRCMRDATRGGVATVLNEFASASGVSMHLDEPKVPIRESVRGACEILGLDPLYLANEGKIVAVVPPGQAKNLIAVMRKHPAGTHSAIIGTVKESPVGTVLFVHDLWGDTNRGYLGGRATSSDLLRLNRDDGTPHPLLPYCRK